MQRITPEEISEMRARGYDRVLLEWANDAIERGKAADELIIRISKAFRGVTLGNGVGLRQARGLDDFEDEETCSAYRESDEKQDWRAISSDDLNHFNSSLSFFDPVGIRFHLPAFMVAELRGEYHYRMSFCLIHPDDQGFPASRLCPMSSARQCVSSCCFFGTIRIISSTALRSIRPWRVTGQLAANPDQPMSGRPELRTPDQPQVGSVMTIPAVCRCARQLT